MKKQGFKFTLIQAGAIALLITPSLRAETYDSVDDLTRDTSKVESLLGKESTGSADDLDSVLEAAKEKKLEQVKKIEEVVELSKKKTNWEKRNKKIDGLKGAQDAVLNKALKQRDTDLKSAKSKLSALADTTSFVNPADFDTSSLPKSCKKGVDFSQTRNLLDQMNSEPGQYLERQLDKHLKEKITANKEAQQKKILDAIAFFKELNDAPEEAQVKGTDPTKKDYSIEKHIESLKRSNKSLKDRNKELTGNALGEFGKFFGELSKLQENDDKVGALGREFSKSMENIRKQTRETSMSGIEKLYQNCTKEKNGMFMDIETSRQYILNDLVEQGTELGMATRTAQLDAQAQLQKAARLSCEDVSSRVDAVFTQNNLTNILNRMRSTKNPTQLLSDAVQAMSEVRNIQAQVGQQLKPLMESCEEIAEGREALKQRVADLTGGAGATGNASIPAPGGSNAGVARRSGVNSSIRTTH